jgi:hypothetical protein
MDMTLAFMSSAMQNFVPNKIKGYGKILEYHVATKRTEVSDLIESLTKY